MRGSSRSCVVYVDVDNTLLRKRAGEEVPDAAVIELVRRLDRQGARLYCWSTGGRMHAKRAALKCRIASLFDGFLAKPNVLIDDERVSEWPECRELSPKNRRAIDARIRSISKRARARRNQISSEPRA